MSQRWKRELGYGEEAPVFPGDHNHVDALFRGGPKTAAARNRFSPYREGPIEVFPGIFSWDNTYLKVLDALSTRMTKDPELTSSTDDLGRVGSNGVRANFLGLRHVTGAPMEPATIVLCDNTLKRKEAKLADGPVNQQHEWIFRSYVRLFFSDLENQGLRIARGTSTGSPSFQKTMSAKLKEATTALKNAEKAGLLYAEGKYYEAFTLYDFGGAYYVVYREQTTDGVSLEGGDYVAKPRFVADLDYARTGGRKGKLFQANKDASNLLSLGVRVPNGFFRTRRRTAAACPFTSNAPLMVVAQAVRKKIYDVYSFSTHHTTRIQKQNKTSGFDFSIATDVSDHDTFWPGWLLDLICDELGKIGYAPWWIEILRTTMRLPVYISAPSSDPSKGHILLGDWTDPRMNLGLPSGIGVTDLMGTLLMGPVYQMIQMDHTAPHLYSRIGSQGESDDFVHSYLQGKEEIAQMSKSDDALLLWKRGPSMAKAIDLLHKMKEGKDSISPYMLVSYEHGGAFLGDVLVYDHTLELRNARFMGNIISYVQNMFCPEYSIDSHKPDRGKRQRPFPGLAVAAASEVFGSAPGWTRVNEIIEEVWFDFYGESFRTMRLKQLEDDTKALRLWVHGRAELEGILDLSPADHEVLAEPSKLGWKFEIDDLNPAVVEMVSSGLAPEDTEDFFNNVMKGTKNGY